MKKSLQNIFKGTCIAATSVLVVGMILLRFIALTETPLYDEVYSLVTADPSIPLSTVWFNILLQDVNLPLFNLALRAWAWIVPNTLPWMRLFSILLSLATLPAVWFCAPKSWTKFAKGVLCSLFACSFIMTLFAHIIRSYSMGMLFTAVFTLLALRILEAFITKQNVSKKLWAGFFITGLLGAYTHFFASGLFFITGLFLFCYACAYKRDRLLVFCATGLSFFLWIPWLLNTYQTMGHFSADWWYSTPKMLASWKILTYNLGSEPMLAGLLGLVVIGFVSVGFHERPVFKKVPEVMLPLFQLVMLVLVVLVVSKRYNLFMERYFLMVLPNVFILLTGLFVHLCKRWMGFAILLPVFLYANFAYFHNHALPRPNEYTGLTDSFAYVEKVSPSKKVLFFMAPISYPKASQEPFVRYFINPASNIELIPFNNETLKLMQAPERLPVVVPLCALQRLLDLSNGSHFKIPEPVVAFGQTCILQEPEE